MQMTVDLLLFSGSTTSGSNYGNHIDVVAPGNYMYGLHHINNNYYGSFWGGTSQATPLVSGLAALLIAQKPYIKYEKIREIIQNTAEDQVGDAQEDTEGWDVYHGHGRINAYKALMVNRDATPFKVNHVSLINAKTKKAYKKVLEGDKIGFDAIESDLVSFVADISIKEVGSVHFVLDGPFQYTQVENIYPYALFGDDPRFNYHGKTLPTGEYTLKVTPYSKPNQKGVAGESLEIHFELVEKISHPLTHFNLLNADNKEVIREMYDGMTIHTDDLPTRKLNILADYEGEEPGSVQFILEGEFGTYKLENIAPFVIFGDFPKGNFLGEALCPGKYRLIAIPYSGEMGDGERGQSMNIDFEVTGSLGVEELSLIDAGTNQQVRTFDLGQKFVFSLDELPKTINFSFIAKCATSMEFVLQKTDQGIIHEQVENIKPFAVWGDDTHGDYYPWTPQKGSYTLIYTPYYETNASGEPGIGGKIEFDIVDQKSTAKNEEASIKIYPNSSDNKVVFEFQPVDNEGETGLLEIYDHTGKLLVQREITPNHTEEVFMKNYGSGIYLARIYLNGEWQTHKVLIE